MGGDEKIRWTGPFVNGKAHGMGELARIVGDVAEPPVPASYIEGVPTSTKGPTITQESFDIGDK